MRSNQASPHFLGVLVMLAFLSSVSALTTPSSSEAEPSAFEANAALVP